jgi:uncharacterized protein (TIGR03067 family)
MLRYFGIGLAAAIFVVGTASGGEDVKKKEQDKLQGEWKITKFTENGREDAEAIKHIGKVVFKGNKLTITLTGPDGTSENKSATLTLMPDKTPKAVDLIPDEGPEKSTKMPGIYEIKGDTLRLCAADGRRSKDRPTEFASKENSGIVLIEFERIKK